MNKKLYNFISWGLQDLIWGGDFVGAEYIPESGPAVFISNHLGALGPIAVGASLPLYLHFWIHNDMLDEALAAQYLRMDFVEPQLHIPPPASYAVAAGIAKLSVPLLRSTGGIPVNHTPEGLLETYRLTTNLLADGKFVLIFPEDNTQPLDPRTKMAPFLKGFARLGELYYERTGRLLRFFPLMVHARKRIVRLNLPFHFSPLNTLTNERIRQKNALENAIRSMYLEAESDGPINLPLANR